MIDGTYPIEDLDRILRQALNEDAPGYMRIRMAKATFLDLDAMQMDVYRAGLVSGIPVYIIELDVPEGQFEIGVMPGREDDRRRWRKWFYGEPEPVRERDIEAQNDARYKPGWREGFWEEKS